MVKDKIISKQKNEGLSNKNYNLRGLQLLLEIRRDTKNMSHQENPTRRLNK